MAHQDGEDIYATLLLSDTYLPGALVLAHSLRDAGTSKKLAVLVTLDTVSAEVVTQLKNVFDYVISVPRIKNEASPGNLHLMNRPDLHSAFTKINLWKQAQFRKIVYIDADVVAYRAPDELFDLPHAFAAAPDIGWPDLFNTGVMVLTPDVGEYYALAAMAQRGISFDGADQGLLNMHFRNSYHRLPFTYNVTPSAHYQYLPACRHFQSGITMVHFIGSDKPWAQGRNASYGGGAYDEMVGRWWAVYDRHYRPASPPPPESNLPAPPLPPAIIQYFVKGEYNPTITYRLTSDESSLHLGSSTYGQHSETLPPPSFQSFSPYHDHQQDSSAPPPPEVEDGHHEAAPRPHHHNPQQHHHHHHHDEPHSSQGEIQHQEHGHFERASSPAPSLPPSHQDTTHSPPPAASLATFDDTHTEIREDQVPGPGPGTSQPPAPEYKNEQYPPPMEPSWDAQWQPPPSHSKPEAMNFPHTHYEMSRDNTPFIPPARYASPPRDMWYQLPAAAPAASHERPAPIFPWETHQPAPTRVFAEPPPAPPEPELTPSQQHSGQSSGYNPHPSFQELGAEPSLSTGSTHSMDLKTEPNTPTMPSIVRTLPPSDPWASFTRSNAWDGMPQIERYVDAFQKQHRRVRSRGQTPGGGSHSTSGGHGGSGHIGLSGTADDGAEDASTQWRRGSRVTDFPTEIERPSLPVTPAPIRRSKPWGSGGPSFGAGGDDDEGDDEDLLPAADGVPQQADWDPSIQLQKLAKEQLELLFQKLGQVDDEGDELGNKTPTPLPPSQPVESEATRHSYGGESPVVSPKPIKPGGYETSSVRNIYNQRDSALSGSSHEDSDEATHPTFSDAKIAEPSYSGPGAAFEKDELYPQHGMTAALPSEEERDILDT
ncbi:glycogenin glucosyltransferase [Sporothrix epigloea]|uniref:Glycogenin glucosyltransferase n=1 Tax=Sporothrix epigloea TaxID=1892477 RepID=A0ABP0DU00_9PEZI